MIDSHLHLDVPAFADDREAILARSRAAGVDRWVVPAITAAHWPRLRDCVAAVRGAYACYGLHPCFVEAHREADLAALHDWVCRERPVAIGECGLDGSAAYRDSLDRQRPVFAAQLTLARECGLPVVLHARGAVDTLLKMLRQSRVDRGVLHSFGGSAQQAKAATDHGLMIGVGGAVTHPRAQRLRSVVASLPDAAIVLETDAPDQPGAAHRGARNEPSWLCEVAEVVASLRGCTVEALAELTTANTRRLFDLPA